MDITHQLNIKSSTETVYNAVATQNGVLGWWSKDCQVGEKEGESSLLKFDKQGKIVEMGFTTKTLVPGKKIVWECTENANPAWIGTEIVTVISGSETGASVMFSHAGFDEQWKGQEPFELTKGGWEHFIASLVSFCETGEGQPW